MTRSALLLPLLFVTTPALAEDQEIVVIGTGLPVAPGDAVYDIVTIERDRLIGSASGRLEDVLRDAAGFQQFRRSDSRSAQLTSQGATLRGLGGNASSRALIVLDGVPQADPFFSSIAFPALDPSRLASARVMRGGGSGIYGSGALAGTVELTSAGPGQVDGPFGRVAYGSRDSIDAAAGVAAKLGGGFLSLSAAYAEGDGFIPIVREDRGPIDRAAPYRQGSVAMRAVVPVGAQTELQANVSGLYDERDRGVDFTANSNRGADASVRLVGRGDWGWEALAYVQLRRFDSEFGSIAAGRVSTAKTLDQYNVPATGLGGRVELRPPVGETLTLRLGADARQTVGSTKELFTYVNGQPTRLRDAGGRTRTLGGYGELSWEPSPALTLTGGARIDRWQIEKGRLFEKTIATGATLTDTRFADRDGWEETGRVGIAWRPADAVTLRSAAYLGWRLPTLNELYRPFRVGADATAANAALSPERVKGIDAGIDFRPAPEVRLSVTGYWNELDDAIANVTLGRGPGTFPGVGFVGAGGAYRQRQNLDSIRARGIEVDGSAGFGPWRLSASYAYVDSRVRAAGPALPLDGLRPAQTPRHQASATIAWADAGWRAALTGRYGAGQYEDDLNQRHMDDAATLDAVVAVPLGRGLTIEARAENVTDTRVEAGISGADIVERATPRTFWIELRLD